jgi:dimethylaniline monooxygenase (N-oxide forming)
MNEINEICVIGAGISGLVMCKYLKDNHLDFICYEAGSSIGGLWNHESDANYGSIYQSLHLNSSKNTTQFKDFPMPDDYPHYPGHWQFLQYIKAYASKFELNNKIQLNSKVTSVEKISQEQYKLTINYDEIKYFKRVIIANGHHWLPNIPYIHNIDNFSGLKLHSKEYKNAAIFQDKKVLVVGIGNSGVEIACDAARALAKQVYISCRTGAHVYPHYIFGIPIGDLGTKPTLFMPLAIKRIITQGLLFLARGRLSDYGIPKPSLKLLTQHPTISSELFSIVGKGMIKFKPDIASFEGKKVIFNDKTRLEFDIIVLATGYKIAFPFLNDSLVNHSTIEKTKSIDLYRRIVSVENEGLIFIGLAQPNTSIIKFVEIQAEWIVNLIKGNIKLPTQNKMLEEIAKYKKTLINYSKSDRHQLQIDFHKYKNELNNDYN